MDNISSISNHMIAHRTIDMYSSFRDARLLATSEDKWIMYDAFTLMPYKHNLSDEEFNNVFRLVIDFIDTEHDTQWKKTRDEFYVLFQYLTVYAILFDVTIRKTEHPDFEIQWKNENYDIEITCLTLPEQHAMSSLSMQIAQHGYTKRTIKTYKKFSYNIEPLGNGLLISQKPTDIKPLEENYNNMINLINRKIESYHNPTSKYKQLIVLGDARSCISVTSNNECDTILQKIKLKRGINVAIIFEAKSDKTVGHIFSPPWRRS